MMNLLGSNDEILRYIERAVRSDVHVRGNEVTISGSPKDNAETERLFKELIALAGKGETLTVDVARRTLGMLEKQVAGDESPAEVLTLNILSRRGRTIRPKTMGQKRYVDAIDEHTIVFGIGPAGTGKTYLAMAKAVQALQAKQVTRIILTRPAVEAGERLGSLPGTLFEKIDPYLRPLYDALHDMVDPDSIPRLITNGTIEVAPLAYMRGRAQPVDTNVLTPSGWRPIGEIAVGDEVIGSDGKPTEVLGVYPQGVKDVYQVTARDGGTTRATDEHLWTVITEDGEQVLQTDEMSAALEADVPPVYVLPMLTGPVELTARDVPMDPYATGLSIRDGSRTSGRSSGSPSGSVATLAEVATVPDAYLYNSVEVRTAVLQGLLDSDGDVIAADGARHVRYTTASAKLRDDVLFLVRSLGGVAEVRERDNLYAVDLRLPPEIAAFRLARKADRYRKGARGTFRRVIEHVEPDGQAEAVCIKVAAEDSLYVTEDMLLTHNTLNDAFIILDEAQNTTPEQMKMFLTRLGFGSKVVVTGDVTQIDLPGASVSGLRVVRDILHNVEDIHFSTLGSADVVRHRLVGDIVDAYEKWDADKQTDDDHGGHQGRHEHRPRRTDRRSGRQ